MVQIVSEIEDVLKIVATFLERPPSPAPLALGTTLADPSLMQSQLVAIMLSQTMFLRTRSGGVIHKIDAATARGEAGAMIDAAHAHGISVCDLAALLRGEADFDNRAFNPNNQDAKPGETLAEAFAHADIGIGQLDGATLEGMPEFRGATPDAIEAKAFDPKWALGIVAATIAGNLAWARAQFVADSSLAGKVPSGDSRVLGLTAYNAGRTDALHIAHTLGRAGGWSYGSGVVARSVAYARLLGEKPASDAFAHLPAKTIMPPGPYLGRLRALMIARAFASDVERVVFTHAVSAVAA